MTFRGNAHDLRVLKKRHYGAAPESNVHLMRFEARVFMQMA